MAVVDGKRGTRLNTCVQIGIVQSNKSDVDFGCTGGTPEVRRGRLSKWKFTTSCASVSYNLVFAWTQTLHWNPAHLCLLAIL